MRYTQTSMFSDENTPQETEEFNISKPLDEMTREDFLLYLYADHHDGCHVAIDATKIPYARFVDLMCEDHNLKHYHFRYYGTEDRLFLLLPEYDNWDIFERAQAHRELEHLCGEAVELWNISKQKRGWVSSKTLSGKKVCIFAYERLDR